MARSRLLVAAVAVMILGCSSGGETITGPEPGTRINILLISPSANAVQRAKLVLDGRDLVTADAAAGSASIALDAMVNNVSRGTHTLRVVILQQATSPNIYVMAGAIIAPDRILELAPVTGLLATGEALETRVTF